MENYTKYKLKSSDELASVLNGRDNLFVIACNKCFKEFETVDEPDCEEFLKFAAEQGKTVTGSAKFDFLCNKMHTERKLQDLLPEGTENVVVISCGLGIQTVADLTGKPVIAASNTLNYRGHHGMALTKKSCDACAQCYLNITGGVCPIVDCSKSLVNGQCGGAKNGKCEVDPNKDCAWEKIYQRLAKQGRLEEFLNQPVQVRDYSKVNFKVINDYVKSIREDTERILWRRSSVRAQGIQRAYRSEEIPGSEDGCDLHVPASWCTCQPDRRGRRHCKSRTEDRRSCRIYQRTGTLQRKRNRSCR